MIRIILALFAICASLNAHACSFVPGTPSEEMGDNIFATGNKVFIGIVSHLNFATISETKSCVTVKFKPIEMIFGDYSDSFSLSICDTNGMFVKDSQQFLSMADSMPLQVGNRGIVGLTKTDGFGKDQEGFPEKYRLITALCFPLFIRTDSYQGLEMVEFLTMLREKASETQKKN